MKLRIVISNFAFTVIGVSSWGFLHRLMCLATVVSRSWSMSLKWPWKRVRRRFFVWPTYWIPQLVQVIR